MWVLVRAEGPSIRRPPVNYGTGSPRPQPSGLICHVSFHWIGSLLPGGPPRIRLASLGGPLFADRCNRSTMLIPECPPQRLVLTRFAGRIDAEYRCLPTTTRLPSATCLPGRAELTGPLVGSRSSTECAGWLRAGECLAGLHDGRCRPSWRAATGLASSVAALVSRETRRC